MANLGSLSKPETQFSSNTCLPNVYFPGNYFSISPSIPSFPHLSPGQGADNYDMIKDNNKKENNKSNMVKDEAKTILICMDLTLDVQCVCVCVCN
jgi:hypothetical protein